MTVDAAEAVGWDMYDPRMTLKATVKTGETVGIGDCCYIDSNGYINVSDTSQDKTHGCALMAASAGDELVLVTHGRLKMVTEQTPGALVYPQDTADGTGSPPDDAQAGTEEPVGFAIEAYLIFVHIDNLSAVGGH